jgi:hypothetical protein
VAHFPGSANTMRGSCFSRKPYSSRYAWSSTITILMQHGRTRGDGVRANDHHRRYIPEGSPRDPREGGEDLQAVEKDGLAEQLNELLGPDATHSCKCGQARVVLTPLHQDSHIRQQTCPPSCASPPHRPGARQTHYQPPAKIPPTVRPRFARQVRINTASLDVPTGPARQTRTPEGQVG